MRRTQSILLMILLFIPVFSISGQETSLEHCNIVWNEQSQNSAESMPCGGGDIGLNVWVEDGELLFYASKSGTFDENNTFLKLGRVRVKLSPNPFDGGEFQQELNLREGCVDITGANEKMQARLKVWVDVFKPVIHVEINSNESITAEAVYENWRYKDRELRKNESFSNSYKWAPPKGLVTAKDNVDFRKDGILFYHRNKGQSVFDVTVKQQGLDSVKHLMDNPLEYLTFGGIMRGSNMVPNGTVEGSYLDTDYKGWKLKSKNSSTSHHLNLCLHTEQAASFDQWLTSLDKNIESIADVQNDYARTTAWWKQYWERSFVFIDPQEQQNTGHWQAGRNYQLFRYMLGCNAYGNYPTKFNGGLFTVDPVFTDSTRNFTPDFRNWGGGTFTAQNQRLVYFPMLKSGDFDMMKPQFEFYNRLVGNAELRSQFYWEHDGACFTEQIENFGLPNCSEYGWKRPDDYDKGRQYNAWLEYQWDTALEICYMILENEHYARLDISQYIPFIESCLTFFNEHYQYLARERGRKTFDANGHLVLYPGSSCETYKMAYNATSTVVALQEVLRQLIALPEHYLSKEQKAKWSEMADRIPPISFTEHEGHKTIAPAKLWERVNNTEVPQLYPVYPWGIYGVGKPDLDVAINTWLYDTDAIKFRSHVGWKQDNIFAARLGLVDYAAELTVKKLRDSDRRFPAFWGPGFDWVPDHNWGGSGMIGLQEMLLQTNNNEIILFPAWPEEWDVHFKLHAPHNTTVEVEVQGGEIKYIDVIPKTREKDIINLYRGKKEK